MRPISDTIIPRHCIVCGYPSPSYCCGLCLPRKICFDINRCRTCFSPNINHNQNSCNICINFTPPYTRARYIWDYDITARDYIKKMKYKPSPKLLKMAAQEITRYWKLLNLRSQYDTLIPMPSTKSRLKLRGLNHIALMLKHLRSENLQLRSSPLIDCLELSPKTVAQTDLQSKQSRINNMRSAFSLKSSQSSSLGHVLLFDDVITTGASIHTACICLMRNGAQSVSALTLARSPGFGSYHHAMQIYDNYTKSVVNH